MGFNLKTIMHVCGIMVTLFLLLWCVVNTIYYATMLTLFLLLVFQVYTLLHYISSTNRQLSRFLDAVKHSDFSMSFNHRGMQGSFAALGRSIDEVLDRFREERSEKEAQATFLHAFVEQVPIAVLAIGENGLIEVSNKALRKLVGKPEIRHLQQIADVVPLLAETMVTLKPGEERTLKLRLGSEPGHLKLSCSLLRLKGRVIRIVSIQDIRDEVEAAELNAWQNLIRVMTHEIMNSITPITSLAETSAQYLKEAEAKIDDDPNSSLQTLLLDAGNAIDTIGKRSHGLMRFVESYRTLTRLPTPEFVVFRVNDLFRSVHDLMEEHGSKRQVAITVTCHPVNLEMHADREMLEQALLNLMLNALDAVENRESPAVQLSAGMRDRGGVTLEVRDNGIGIEEANLENIFIPFFTTKRNGSGIGLSIVKQIVNLNGGQIGVITKINEGTTFRLHFPPS